MPLILNIETSSTICSACLAKDGVMVDYRIDKQGNSHARVLTAFIEELAQKNNLDFAGLDAIAISAGPGSYTGLRIGASVAKGLCYALNKPLIAVPTLLALAGGMFKKINDPHTVYMPALDARRMEIYTAVFDAGGKEILSTRAAHVDATLEGELKPLGNLFVGGSGAGKCKQVFKSGHVHFIDNIDCDARLLIPFAEERALKMQYEDVAYFEPLYLKEFGVKT